jgi:hypothetical protein
MEGFEASRLIASAIGRYEDDEAGVDDEDGAGVERRRAGREGK